MRFLHLSAKDKKTFNNFLSNGGICLYRRLIFSTIYWMNVFILLKNLSRVPTKSFGLIEGNSTNI
jgi:hypothetical protein